MKAVVTPLFAALPEEGQSFIKFWYRYPKKVARTNAERAWARLSDADRIAAYEKLPAHVAYWQLSQTLRQYIPHGATWLNQRRWEDELDDLNSPLTDLGRCQWNRNGTREPGKGQCDSKAMHTAPVAHANAGQCYCQQHARMLGFGGPR